MANTPYPIDPVLTAIAVAYRNPAYIADLVLPRTPVGREEFNYWEFPVEETFRLPDTTVGRRGRVNEVLLTATEKTASTQDYGLEDPIPFPDIDQAQAGAVVAGFAPVQNAVATLTDYIMLDREKRTADLVLDAAQYPTPNKIQLSGTDQWSDFANSDPVADIIAGIDASLVRPNVMVMGNAVWSKLRQHPKIAKAIHGTSGDVAVAARRMVADLFELDELLVGESRLDTAKYGQSATLARVWGKHALLFRRDPNANTRGQTVTFGVTAQYQSRVSGQEEDSKIGLRGGTRVRVGESVKELIVASQAAYFIQDAVA